jgi:two-component system NtrC family sensor kinase
VAANFLNIRLQRQHMEDLVADSAVRTVETIRRATRHAMLEFRPDDLQRSIEEVGRLPGIEKVRIFDKQGVIRRSSSPEEVGTPVDKAEEQCHVCHKEDRPPPHLDVSNRIRKFSLNGEAIMGVTSPLVNAPDCSTGCHEHSPDEQLLGILDVHLSLGSVDAMLRDSEWQMGIGVIATGIAILVLAGFLIWRLVLRPVRQLTTATGKAAEGDLSARVPVESTDEMGAMAHSWNAMIEELERAKADLEEWNRTLEARVDEKTNALEVAHERMLLVEKMASLGKLAGVVAHEINNPLAGINTYARLLRKKFSKREGEQALDEETLKVLELVESETGRCGDIVRNLLLFSRTPGARFAEEDLRKLLDRCVMLVRHQAELQEVGIEVRVADDLPPVECDASQIQQVVVALVMNAIEAMGPGGGVTIGAKPTASGNEIELTVADTGRGIAEEDLARIFEPYFTTKEEGKGVGLGLAVVYGIVQRHHGEIEAQSEIGAWTIITIRLPIRQPSRESGREESL